MLKVKIILRSILRRIGITKLLVKLFYPKGYEERFDDAMFKCLRSGDTVWDVGANVGYYTVKFSEAVGSSGSVHAFEPIPDTLEILRRKTANYLNIDMTCCALGDTNNNLSMSNDNETGSPTNKILVGELAQENLDTTLVVVRTGDSLIQKEELKVPNFIKIDVEGHEYEVIRGISDLLKDSRLHTLAMEIHFALLEERGLGNAPSIIVDVLKKNNFNISWTDPSHLLATRR